MMPGSYLLSGLEALAAQDSSQGTICKDLLFQSSKLSKIASSAQA